MINFRTWKIWVLEALLLYSSNFPTFVFSLIWISSHISARPHFDDFWSQSCGPALARSVYAEKIVFSGFHIFPVFLLRVLPPSPYRTLWNPLFEVALSHCFFLNVLYLSSEWAVMCIPPLRAGFVPGSLFSVPELPLEIQSSFSFSQSFVQVVHLNEEYLEPCGSHCGC